MVYVKNGTNHRTPPRCPRSRLSRPLWSGRVLGQRREMPCFLAKSGKIGSPYANIVPDGTGNSRLIRHSFFRCNLCVRNKLQLMDKINGDSFPPEWF